MTIINVNNLNRVTIGVTRTVNTRIAILSRALGGGRSNLGFKTSRCFTADSPRAFGGLTKAFSLVVGAMDTGVSVSTCFSLLALSKALIGINTPTRPLSIGIFSLVNRHHSFTNSVVKNVHRARRVLGFYTGRGVIPGVRIVATSRVSSTCRQMLTSSIGCQFMVSVDAV